LSKNSFKFQFAPVFCGIPRTDELKKKSENALSVFETYLKRQGTKYAAAGNFLLKKEYAAGSK
jgi:hypothetical protein